MRLRPLSCREVDTGQSILLICCLAREAEISGNQNEWRTTEFGMDKCSSLSSRSSSLDLPAPLPYMYLYIARYSCRECNSTHLQCTSLVDPTDTVFLCVPTYVDVDLKSYVPVDLA